MAAGTLTLVCDRITSRITYTARTLGERLGIPVVALEQGQDLPPHGAIVYYGTTPVAGGLSVYAAGLLSETGIRNHQPDLVRLKSLGIEGEVLEINGENLLVTYGESLITTVKVAAVERTKTRGQRPAAEPAKSKKYDWSISQRRLNFSSEIDIRGKRGEEAVDIVRHFVDDAMVVGVSDLRILHGKGNGILKSMIREYLNSLNVVKSCKDERVELGGAGITLVTLDF